MTARTKVLVGGLALCSCARSLAGGQNEGDFMVYIMVSSEQSGAPEHVF